MLSYKLSCPVLEVWRPVSGRTKMTVEREGKHATLLQLEYERHSKTPFCTFRIKEHGLHQSCLLTWAQLRCMLAGCLS